MSSVAIIGTRGYPSYYGGFETAVRKLAPDLADMGWDVTVYGRRGATKPDDPALDPRIKRRISWGVETQKLSTLSHGLTDHELRKWVLSTDPTGTRYPDARECRRTRMGTR